MRCSVSRCAKCAAKSIIYVVQWYLSQRGIVQADEIHVDSDDDPSDSEEPKYSYANDTTSTIREKIMRGAKTHCNAPKGVTLQPLTSKEKIWLEIHRSAVEKRDSANGARSSAINFETESDINMISQVRSPINSAPEVDCEKINSSVYYSETAVNS